MRALSGARPTCVSWLMLPTCFSGDLAGETIVWYFRGRWLCRQPPTFFWFLRKMSTRHRKLIFSVVAFAAISVAVIWQWCRTADPQTEFAAARREQFTDPERAYGRCLQLLKSTPDSRSVLMLAGELADRTNLPAAALTHYQHLAAASPQDVEIRNRVAQLALQLGRLSEAYSAILEMDRIRPGNSAIQRQHADLLLSLGNRLESLKPLFMLVRNRNYLLDELIMLGSAEELLEDRKLLDLALTHDSEKAAALTALGRLEAYSNKFTEAVKLLRQAVDTGNAVPQDAVPALGRALLAANDFEQLNLWRQHDAPGALQHPDTQFVLGEMSARNGHLSDAVSHLNSAIQFNPNHRAACQLMGSVVAESGDIEGARRFLDRAALLDETERVLRRLLFKHRDAALMRRTAELMELLGRPTEAWAWWIALKTYHPDDSAGAAENATRLSDRASAASDQVERPIVDQLFYRGSISESPRHSTHPELANSPASTVSQIRFEDIAPQLGLDTPYFGGFSGEPRGLWLYQVDGGGVSVTDADGDGHPDLYFVHGNVWPPDLTDSRCRNRMYRSRERLYDDVSSVSGADSPGLGQSAAVGDCDADGFEDLYIAGIGARSIRRSCASRAPRAK